MESLSTLQFEDNERVQTDFFLSFYGCLRASEIIKIRPIDLVIASTDSSHPLGNGGLSIRINSHQARGNDLVPILHPNAMRRLRSLITSHTITETHYIFPFTSVQLSDIIKEGLETLGNNSNQYNLECLRRDGIQYYRALGLPDRIIMQVARFSVDNAYERYV